MNDRSDKKMWGGGGYVVVEMSVRVYVSSVQYKDEMTTKDRGERKHGNRFTKICTSDNRMGGDAVSSRGSSMSSKTRLRHV
jgi:hypothetical protein